MSFFHGAKTIPVPSASGTTNAVPSCIIGLIGVSPVGDTQALTICNNSSDDLQFGESTPDNNIAKTLAIIRSVVQGASKSPSDGSCAVVVVNVYNTHTHKVAMAATGTPDTAGNVALGLTIIGDLNTDVEITQGETAVNVAAGGSYVYGVDYTLDRYGNFKDVTGTYIGQELTFSGYNLDATTVIGPVIAGTIDGDNVRTGAQLFDLCNTLYGFKPKILLAPTYATLSGVATVLNTKAASYRGIFLSDAPPATSQPAALALRAAVSGFMGWNTQTPQTRPLFPLLKGYDQWVNDNVAYPFSAWLAGMYVANDNNTGPWDSVSNQQIPGVTGPEIQISTGFSDPNSEANQLNAAGIMTYMTGYGLGFNTWGNRNASFPADSTVLTFDNVYRMDGIVADSMENSARPYIDKGITAALIDIMKTNGNNFLKTYIQQGAILPGSAITYNKLDNNPSDLANGIIKFRRTYMVTTPAENIQYMNILDISLFGNLTNG